MNETLLVPPRERGYQRTVETHRWVLRDYGVNPSFLQFEGASELSNVLLPGISASALKLAEACVDSLAPNLDYETRWDCVATLRPAFQASIDNFREAAWQSLR